MTLRELVYSSLLVGGLEHDLYFSRNIGDYGWNMNGISLVIHWDNGGNDDLGELERPQPTTETHR